MTIRSADVTVGQTEPTSLPRLMVLSLWNPFPASFGGQRRVLSLLRALAKARPGLVDIIAFADDRSELEISVSRAASLGVGATFVLERTLAESRITELPERLLASATGKPYPVVAARSRRFSRAVEALLHVRPYDWVFAETPFMAPYALATNARFRIVNLHNVESDVYRQRFENTPNVLLRMYRGHHSGVVRRFELSVLSKTDAALVVSDEDRQTLIEAGANSEKLFVVPLVVDTEALSYSEPQTGGVPTLVFVGAMFYQPNVEAATHFAKEVLPRVRRAVPRVRLLIVGRDPTAAVRELALSDAGVSVTGAVDDVVPYLRMAHVFVAPIRSGGGVKTKVLEAMAVGTPVVGYAEAFRGIAVESEREVVAVRSASEMAAAIVDLLGNDHRRRELGRRARECVESRYSQRQVDEGVAQVLETLEDRCERA